MVLLIIKGLGIERNLLLTRVCIIGIIINDTLIVMELMYLKGYLKGTRYML